MADRVIDSGDLRQYRTEIPNLIDDMDLSVYAFRLYVHLKRVAGASEDGACWQSTRTLAKHCGMSVSKVSQSKQELVDAGLIEIDQGGWKRGKADIISICDIWPQNFVRYSSEIPVRDTNTNGQTCSRHEHPVRDTNAPVRVVEHKKEPMKKEPIEERTNEEDDREGTNVAAQSTTGGGRRHRDHDPDFGELCRHYEQEFGFLSPIAADQLSDLLDEYKSKQMVIDAFEVSVQANKRSLRYVDGILRNWRSEGKNGPRKEGAHAASGKKVPAEGWHAGLIKPYKPKRQYSEAEIDEWLDSLDDQPPVPAVRPLRKRPGAAAAD